jgi:hypothetical protein
MSHRLRLQSFLNVDKFIWVPVLNAFLSVLLIQVAAAGAEQSEKSTADQAVATDADQTGHLTKIVDPTAAQPAKSDRRTELNLLGRTDTGSGESQRNENVQFNLIENNALKDLLLRMGTTATIVPEFRPDRNYYGAEFGDRIPAQIHVAANPVSTVHGSIYEAHNNSVFSARSFFQVGDVQPAHTNDYGFSFATPLWGGATFSVDASQQKIRGSVNGNVLVPTLAERVPLATDPATRQIVERFLAAYPAAFPNRTDINERMLNTNSSQNINTNNAAGRFDQRLGPRDRLSLSYLFTSQAVDAFELIAGQNPDTTTRAHTARLTWNRSWSAATVTDFSAGFDRVHSLIVPEPNAVGPSVSFGAVLDPLGPGSDIPIDRVQNGFHYAGLIQQARGRHTWSAGGEFVRRQINGDETSSQRGVIYFRNDFGRDAITNFRMGIPSRFSTGIGYSRRGFRSWESQAFAGDDWHARPNLTINYGLRYQPVTAPAEVNHLTKIPYGCDCHNFAPHFGFAYQLPDEWGLLRGTYGLQYGEIFPTTFQQLRFDPPLFYKMEFQAPNLVDPLGGLTAADLGPQTRTTLFVLSPNLSTPYSHQYNFSWEPRPSSRWKLQLGYVGSRSHKILMLWTENRALPVTGIPQITQTIEERRPDQRYYEVRRVLNGAHAYFDAARISLVTPNWRGLMLETAYWFSKAIDTGANYTNAAINDDAKQGRAQSQFYVLQDLKGLSSFDQTHAFLTRFSWTTPAWSRSRHWLADAIGRWEFGAITLVKSGTPFDVLSGSDGPGYGNVDGAIGDRPNLLDPAILGRTIGNPDTATEMLPRSAFAFMNPTDARGNLGHNVFRKGGVGNMNASLTRTWKVSGEKSLTFRVESINFFNTPQFAAPGNELASSNFGQITNTLNDGRTFQFWLRFRF